MSSGASGTALATRFGLTQVDDADWTIDASWDLPQKDNVFERTIPGSLQRRTHPTSLALTTTSVTSLTTAAVERASADLSELTDELLRVSKVSFGAQDYSKMLKALREWTALKPSDLAEALHVSRRAIYFWMGGGSISHENQSRLSLLVNEIKPLTRLFRPDRMRVWLSSGEPRPIELLKGQDFESFRELAQAAIAQQEIPVLPTRLIQEGDSADDMVVRPLSGLQSQLALMAFNRPRQKMDTPPWSPPEISDSPEEDD